jgi:hypothetical protein
MIPTELKKQREGGFIRLMQNKTTSDIIASYFGKYTLVDGKGIRDYEYLGKVVDKKENVFFNNKLGFFKFTIEDGYTLLNNWELVDPSKNINEHAILNYGDIWLFDNICRQTGFISVLKIIIPTESDTLMALLAYKFSSDTGVSPKVFNWYEKSYAKILYPYASLSSESISSFIHKMGETHVYEHFYDLYHEYLKTNYMHDTLKCDNVLIVVLVPSIQ